MKTGLVFLLIIVFPCLSFSQQFVPGSDEAKIPSYTLPDPLIFNNGTPVINKNDWDKRRTEIYKTFEKEVFGAVPEWTGSIKAATVSRKENALNGLAKRREIRLDLINGGKKVSVMMLLYLPQNSKDAPVFLSYNFNGNHTTTAESDVLIPDSWVNNDKTLKITDNHANEAGRGSSISRWPMKEIVEQGFGVATIYYGDVDPDFDDGFKNGVHQLFNSQRDSASWGSLATWSWTLSRVMDYFETDKEINARKIIVIGHSRLGKSALWTGASDKRFAVVVSNCSGCGGAALSKRIFGETVGKINKGYPHWFCNNYKKYNEKEELLPVDQHELLVLIAPRPLYVASASEDLWADPKGEFLSCVSASPVYELLGKKGLPSTEMPALGQPVSGDIGYHIRRGKHDITLYDWQCYMDFAARYLKLGK
jgi:hypothetical protein